jgi:hypothetical protein
LNAAAIDAAKHKMVYFATYLGFFDWVYSVTFDMNTCKIDDMVKIWNDEYAAANLGSHLPSQRQRTGRSSELLPHHLRF